MSLKKMMTKWRSIKHPMNRKMGLMDRKPSGNQMDIKMSTFLKDRHQALQGAFRGRRPPLEKCTTMKVMTTMTTRTGTQNLSS